jgi:hypothetical protein
MALVAVAASCDTENVGNPPVFFAANITAPAGPFHRLDNTTWTVNIVGGSAPYTVDWNFGGAATPNTVNTAGVAGTSSNTTVQLTAEGTFTVNVTVTDANNVTATDSESITVLAALNQPPVVNSAVFNAAAKTITVTVSDPDDGATLTVTATPPAGVVLDSNTKTAAATGPLTATFNVSASDIIAGATGNVGISVSDGIATGDFAGGVSVTLDPLAPAADALYCIPLTGSAATGADVQVLVLTGVPANPFQYMVGAGVTIESDATYVGQSFDVGVPDGTADVGSVNPVDGIWATMNPGGGFLLAPDNFIQSTDIGGGRERWDFNITPLGGSNLTTASGALFNAKFTFSAAGTKTFGFQDVSGVKRTYYADDATEYFWGNIANDGTGGIPNSVTIN